MEYIPKKLKYLWITNPKTASFRLQKTQIIENAHYISRLAERNLLDFGKTYRAKILLGPRQVGKTTSIRAYERNYPESPVTIVTPEAINELYESESAPLAQ